MKKFKTQVDKREKIIFGIIFLFAFLLTTNAGLSQQFTIFNVDTTDFPTMKVMYVAKTPAGGDYANVTVDDFDLYENGISMDPTLSIDCNEVEAYPPIAVHFLLDASQSMGEDAGNGESRFKWVKYGINVFLDTFHFTPPSQVAALTFSRITKNFSGWVEEDSMRNWVEKALKVEFGGTDFGPPFVAHAPSKYQGGLFNLATRDPNLRRVAIFISDGQPESEFTQTVVDSIITVAKREKIQVYAIFITSSVNSDIYDICRMTGGKAYQAWSKADLSKIFREIVGNIQSKKTCKLVWESPFGCDEASRARNIKVIFHRIPDSAKVDFIAPTTSIANVSVSATELKFGTPSNGGTTRQPLELVSDVTDMTIAGFNLQPANGKYTIDWNGKSIPFVIPKGQKHTIYIDYIENPPTGSELTELHLLGNPCNPPVVNLIAPCGGKILNAVDFGDVSINTTKDTTINCIYENTTPIDVNGDVQLTGTDAAEFEIVSGGGTFTLKPGDCLAVTVRFKPNTSPGTKTAKLEYNTDADCGTAETNLTGNSVQSSFPLPLLDFGKRRVLSDSTADYVIKNTISSPVTISSIVLKNTSDTTFILKNVPALPVTLQANESITLTVKFVPLDEGTQTNYIDIKLDNVDDVVSGQLTGFGTLPKISAQDVDFGSVITGNTLTKTLDIENPSTTEDLTIFEVIMQSNPDFAFSTGTDLTDLVVKMNNGSISLPIEFTPLTAGIKTTKVIIKCDATTGNPPYLAVDTVEIRGVALGLTITPTEYNFGRVLTCGSKETTFVIDNRTGEEPITINSVIFNGPNASAFTVVPPQPTTIPVGETANLVVNFAPSKSGSYVATMEVSSSSGNATINLTGIGFIMPVKAEITKPEEKLLPGSTYTFKFSVPVPDMNGATISALDVTVNYYSKSFQFIDDNNVTVPNIQGWTWNIDGTKLGEITIKGSGPDAQMPYNFDFSVTLKTFLADVSTSDFSVTPSFPGINCLSPVADTLPFVINTCFTEGRLVLVSDVNYYLQQVKPNPAGSKFTLNYAVAFDGETKIEIYNAMGELVKIIKNGFVNKGKYEMDINTSDMTNGVYFIRMESGSFAKVRKLVINK